MKVQELRIKLFLVPDVKTDSTNSGVLFNNGSTNPQESFQGFQTARGRKVSVSEEAVKKAKNLLTVQSSIENRYGDGRSESQIDIETETKESTKVRPRLTL